MQSTLVNKNTLDFNYIFLDVQINKPAILFLFVFFSFMISNFMSTLI